MVVVTSLSLYPSVYASVLQAMVGVTSLSLYPSVYASVLQVMLAVMFLALYLQTVSQAPHRFEVFETQSAWVTLLCPPVCLLGHFLRL